MCGGLDVFATPPKAVQNRLSPRASALGSSLVLAAPFGSGRSATYYTAKTMLARLRTFCPAFAGVAYNKYHPHTPLILILGWRVVSWAGVSEKYLL